MDPNVDIYGTLGFVRNLDGSLTRQREVVIPSGGPNLVDPSLVLTKDIPINQSNNTWVRVILPREVVDSSISATKLPIIFYFHGGGFVALNVDASIHQDLYRSVATKTPAVFISVEYRRAPEHRLPAAYDDCMETLHWIRNTDDEWIVTYADISKCFLMGISAGANIAYRVGLSATSSTSQLKPLEIKGLVLQQPYFGRKERAESELRLVNDKVLPLCLNDVMWEMSLPIGVDRDHVYCNPMVEIKSNPGLFDRIKLLELKILVTGCDGDPLIDRQVEFVKTLQEMGLRVMGRFAEGGSHGFDMPLQKLCTLLREFTTS